MMEIVVFAIVFVVAQVLAGLGVTYLTFKLAMNKKFIKKTTKNYIKLISEITEEMDEDLKDIL